MTLIESVQADPITAIAVGVLLISIAALPVILAAVLHFDH